MIDETLDELARSAQHGGRPEMERFLDALRPVVARWALVLTGGPDTAEDVAQTVLLRVHRSLVRYTPEGRLRAWAYRITRNVVADVHRSARRERVRAETLTAEGLAPWLPKCPDPLEIVVAVDQLRRFMNALSPQQRAVLDLIELQGYSVQEVAEMLEIAPSTVRVHVHRARAAMGEAAGATEEVRGHG